MVGVKMSGNLVLRIIESALQGDVEKVKLLTNMLSSELSKTDPDFSMQLAKASSQNSLKGMEDSNPHHKHRIPPVNGDGAKFLMEEPSIVNAPKPNLSKSVEEALLQIVAERKQVNKLEKHGLEPTKTVLFTGPPGVGKTMSALWLASELKLPLQLLDLASLMSSFLGKTGNNLKSVFNEAISKPCVLLLDEFDAIAKHRGDDIEVGELKRLVTVLLQVLDSWPPSSLLIAATNHPELLDSAVWRRFDEQIEFDKPTEVQIKAYLMQLTEDPNVTELYPLFKNYSFSQIKTTIDKSKRYCVINNIDMIQDLINRFFERGTLSELSIEERKEFVKPLVSGAGLSQRKTALLLNLSRPTVKNVIES